MNGMRIGIVCILAVLLAGSATSGLAQDYVVNGYTYVAPSTYLAPPIVVYDPALVVPTRTVILPRTTYVPPPVIYAEPAFVTQTVVPYNPVWNYGPVIGATAFRERAYYSRNGLEYKYQAYVPGRAAPVYTYRIDSERHGVKIRERYR